MDCGSTELSFIGLSFIVAVNIDVRHVTIFHGNEQRLIRNWSFRMGELFLNWDENIL